MRKAAAMALGLAMSAAAGMAIAKTEQAKLKIGFMAVLSGVQAALGQDMYDGFMLYLKLHDGKLGVRPIDVI